MLPGPPTTAMAVLAGAGAPAGITERVGAGSGHSRVSECFGPVVGLAAVRRVDLDPGQFERAGADTSSALEATHLDFGQTETLPVRIPAKPITDSGASRSPRGRGAGRAKVSST